MNSGHSEERITLYLYGELEGEELREFEAELTASPELERAVERERRLLRALDARPAADVSEAFLGECRQDVMREVYRAERARPPAATGLLARLAESLGTMRVAWRPTAALALLVLGFWAGRASENWRGIESLDARLGGGQAAAASLTGFDPAMAEIHSIDLDAGAGRVSIVVEERRVITGAPSDPLIEGLLISTTRSANSGVRLDSLDLLRRRTDNHEIRRALVRALLEDDNPGVRLKALDGLAAHKDEPEVRRALIEALRGDGNPGVRVHAIQLLTEKPDRDLAGVLQEVMRGEPNGYVRLQCERTLRELNASLGHY